MKGIKHCYDRSCEIRYLSCSLICMFHSFSFPFQLKVSYLIFYCHGVFLEQRDAATAPNVGDRVPYVIIKAAKGAKVTQHSELVHDYLYFISVV